MNHRGKSIAAVFAKSAGYVRVAVPKDGACCAKGCTAKARHTTLMGMAFCQKHFVEFYSAGDGPRLKPGVLTS